jgi:hypothetical protein
MGITQPYERSFDEDVANAPNDGPECEGRVTTNSHETVCDDCGLVLTDEKPGDGFSPDGGKRFAESPRVRLGVEAVRFGAAFRQNTGVIQHRLQLEHSRRVIHASVPELTSPKITVLGENAPSGIVCPPEEQLDGERRVLDVEPLNQINE